MADLTVFVTVAEERSFTRAATRLGLTQSALSQIVRRLEERLGIRLLARTTRSVAPTEAGERLLQRVGPMLDDIEKELSALGELRSRPAGKLRITAIEHVADTILWPAVRGLVSKHPDIEVEIHVDYRPTDIVAEGFHAGVRLGRQLAPGMVAMRISPDQKLVVVGAPAYLRQRSAPKVPKELEQHRCINLRLPPHGALLPWNFRKGRHEMKVITQGPLTFNTLTPVLRAAEEGLGLAFTVLDSVKEQLAAGTLVTVLDDWSVTEPGYHLYYPSRRHHSAAFALLLDALRHPRKA